MKKLILTNLIELFFGQENDSKKDFLTGIFILNNIN